MNPTFPSRAEPGKQPILTLNRPRSETIAIELFPLDSDMIIFMFVFLFLLLLFPGSTSTRILQVQVDQMSAKTGSPRFLNVKEDHDVGAVHLELEMLMLDVVISDKVYCRR